MPFPVTSERALEISQAAEADRFLLTNRGSTLYYGPTSAVSSSNKTGELADGASVELSSVTWVLSEGHSVVETTELTETLVGGHGQKIRESDLPSSVVTDNHANAVTLAPATAGQVPLTLKPKSGNSSALSVLDGETEAVRITNAGRIALGSGTHEGLIHWRGDAAIAGTEEELGAVWLTGIDVAHEGHAYQDLVLAARIREGTAEGDDYIYIEYNPGGAPRTTFGLIDHTTVRGAFEFSSWANPQHPEAVRNSVKALTTVAIRTNETYQTGKAFQIFDSLGEEFGVTTDGELRVNGRGYPINFQSDWSSNGYFGLFQNAIFSTSTAKAKWEKTHASLGQRGIMFDYTAGIRFFAQATASTEGEEFTPTEVLRLGNDGSFTHKGSSGKVGFFNTAGAAKQSGGEKEAGETYNATAKEMINIAYKALRSYGLLS